ncbi:25660_t:CDS:1, partial [Gigaspora rosea]
DQFTVRKATEFLRQYSIKPIAAQTLIASQDNPLNHYSWME